jgi:hypothetical protein
MTTGRINQVTILCRTSPTDGSRSPRNGISGLAPSNLAGEGRLLTISQGIHPEYQPGRESLPRETCIRNSHSRFGEFVLKAPLEGGTLGSYPTAVVRKVNAQSKSHRPTREFRPCELPPKRQHRAHVPGPVWHLDSLPKEGTDVQASSPITASPTHSLHSPTASPPDGGRPSQGAEGRSTTWRNSSPAQQLSRAEEGVSRLPTISGMLSTFPYSHKPRQRTVPAIRPAHRH